MATVFQRRNDQGPGEFHLGTPLSAPDQADQGIRVLALLHLGESQIKNDPVLPVALSYVLPGQSEEDQELSFELKR